MRTVGAREAKTRLSDLLSEVAGGESITITRKGKPVAILSPVPRSTERDVRAIIEEFQSYSRERARARGPVTPDEIREMIEEGRA